MIEIPLPKVSPTQKLNHTRLNVEIEGLECYFHFYYNNKSDYWSCQVLNEELETQNIFKCVCNFDILNNVNDFLSEYIIFFYKSSDDDVMRANDMMNENVKMYLFPRSLYAT